MMLKIGEKKLNSRLMLGTGKYDNTDVQKRAVEASNTNVLTFAVRRMSLENAAEDAFAGLDLDRFELLPNTAGASTAEEAVRTAKLAREAGLCDMIKVEVIGCSKTLLPDPVETLKASEELLADGFTVLTYTSDDVVLARKLQEMGCHAVMPAASPIGSGLGIVNPYNLRHIVDQAEVPIIVDAGLGSPADATFAMELGADGVLLNSAVARAQDPVKMAEAMKLAVEAGRLGFEAGRIPKKMTATASSPLEGVSPTS
ncbi:Thiazole biosynthesis protein ThiG [Salisediminibacterium beveridgei]|uniref:Thiazole synthase n=2 Tax=Salisediminibacterium beveridgei TaxID=632773 RepID=A0A1D7QX71_9BACI|nr:Thiazole biosynthesis protein ThiG [Salisediminibacterium beveridgei]